MPGPGHGLRLSNGRLPLQFWQRPYTEYDLGTHAFSSAGAHAIRFTATGKNAFSTGYGIFPGYGRLFRG